MEERNSGSGDSQEEKSEKSPQTSDTSQSEEITQASSTPSEDNKASVKSVNQTKETKNLDINGRANSGGSSRRSTRSDSSWSLNLRSFSSLGRSSLSAKASNKSMRLSSVRSWRVAL